MKDKKKLTDRNTISRYHFGYIFVLLISIITLTPAFLNTEKVWAQPIPISIKVGEHPQNVEYNPINGNIYVSNSTSGDISITDSKTNKVINKI